MEANELMIGDYVYNHRDWECPIVEIHKNSAIVIARHYGEEEFLLSDLRPIPLTSEIFEKNGFEKSYSFSLTADGYKKVPVYKYKNMKQVQDICKNLIKVCVNLDGSKYDVEFGIGSHIFDLEYVHQFQHALKLCGIEKEIIL